MGTEPLVKVWELAKTDLDYKKLVDQVVEGLIRRYWIGLWYASGNGSILYPYGRLRYKLMEESHDIQWAGHLGRDWMFALMPRVYFWLRMEVDIEAFVKYCLVCQQDKVERSSRLVYFNPYVHRRDHGAWSQWISCPAYQREGDVMVMVVVDRFSKYTLFSAAPHACPIELVPDLFYQNVVKHHGVPTYIVSDRDARFTGKFWRSLSG